MDLPDEVHEAMLALGREEPPSDGGITFVYTDEQTARVREQLDQRVKDAEAAARLTNQRKK